MLTIMSISCAIILCVLLGAASCAPSPSVFQRNGLQREQEGALHREPFEPQSPFQISHGNVQSGNALLVPPTIDLGATYSRPAVAESYLPQGSPSRNFLNHFEILNKDALVGLLIEKDIPFYVKTIVEPQKPVQTKIHVMRIPKKMESTSPLPDINLNMVEIVNMKETQDIVKESYGTDSLKQAYGTDSLKQVKSFVQKANSDDIVKVTERRPEDVSAEQEAPLLTVTDTVQSRPSQNENGPSQNDDPNTGVHAHTSPPSIWEHIGSAYDKAKEKTSELAGKAKDKTEQLFERAKDALDSNESHSKEKDSAQSATPNDDPNAGAAPPSPPSGTPPVYEHAIIYTPDKRPDSKTIWEHLGSAYDKAKEKTSQFVVKAKDKTDQLIEKAKEKAKDVLDSDEGHSKEKGVVNPADDI